MARLKIGDRPKRIEDTRFLTGRGCYLDDLAFEGMRHAVILRSPHAHARIGAISTSKAATAPGVVTILTGADQAGAGIGAIRPYEQVNVYNGEPFAFPTHHPLALDRVRHVGEPVALVVAETRNQALDAAERIEVEYKPLPAMTSIEQALAIGRAPYSDDRPGCVCLEWRTGDAAATDAAFARATHVTRLAVHSHRIVTNPMEPRGGIGIYDPDSGRYTLHLSAQSLHLARDRIAETLGVAKTMVRLVAPDVGGGFGMKNFMYAEQVLLLWAARAAGRPVKWINDRSEGFVSDHQARGHAASAELALDGDGKFLALRLVCWGDLGAYLTGSMARIHTEQFAALPGGPYAIPAVHLQVGAVFTNTVPIGVTRGPGFAETANLMERLVDRAAAETGIDRAELRRRNLIPAGAMPYTNGVGKVIDSGSFAANVDAALDRASTGFEGRRKESEANGGLRGLGLAYHIKATFGAPEENVELRFDADDRITFTTGTQSIGQGHETTFPQIISDLLGIPFETIRYRAGDTDLIPKGGGHGSSRATYMAGTAIFRAVEKVVARGRPVAAQVLEAAEADIEFGDGRFGIAGTDRSVDLFEVARRARAADGKGLDTLEEFTREAHTYPNGCHVAEVEIDPETGVVSLARYTAVDDYGRIINPMVIEGQVHGAIAQGVGQALLEGAVFDPDSGQVLAGSFMDYCMPRADDLPSFDVDFNQVRCTTNPLGTKGSGEAGAIAGFPAVANAVIDALAPLGVTGFTGPATPERIWRLIRERTTR